MSFVDNMAALVTMLGDWIRSFFGNIHKKKKELWVRLGVI